MADYLQSSVLWRILQVIRQFFRMLAEGSLVFAVFRRSWQNSGVRSGGLRFLQKEDAACRSGLWGRFRSGTGERLAKLHTLPAWIRGSLLWRLLSGLWRWLCGSRLLGWVFRDGVTGFILTALGLYAGLDWLLRDVAPVPVLSSVWDELLLLFSAAWIVWKQTVGPARLKNRGTDLDVFVLLYVGIGLMLLFLVSPYFSVALSGYRAACQYVLWFFVVTRLLRDDRDLKRLYGLMVLVAFLISLHGIYQYIIGAPIPSHWTDMAEASVRTRSYSIFGSPNILADFMVMFAPMAAGIAYAVREGKKKLLAWFVTACMCVACLFTMSRGGWVAMAVAIVVFALLVDRRLFLVMLAALVCAMFLPFVASRLGYLFTEDFANSTANGGRASRWALGLGHLYSSNPVFGFGQGMFGGAVAMQNKLFSHIQYFYLDNYYLKTLVEMGYVGLGGFILMQLAALLTGCRCLYRAKQRADGSYAMTAGIFSGLCGVLVHCYFENIFEEPYMMACYWILIAMMMYLGIYRNRND